MSKSDFAKFHNEVFNLPRDSFSNFDTGKIKSLSEYLYSIRFKFPYDGLTLSNIYLEIHKYLLENKVANPNRDFELLFNLKLTKIEDIKNFYSNIAGRKFRHWMELASLLELLANKQLGYNRSKRILTTFTEELYLVPNNLITILLRDIILSINTNSNPCLSNLDSYYLYKNLNFRPAMAILNYMYKINRPCTKFELAIFFGRPDYSLNSEYEIIEEALNIASRFPINQIDQIEYYFRLKNWTNLDGTIFLYTASQEPYFKFNAFFILMGSVGLVNYDLPNNTLTMTSLSRSFFSANTTPEAVEIENLLDEVEKLSDDAILTEKVTKNRSDVISNLISTDNNFIETANIRAAAKSGEFTTATNYISKLKRDELIREISKQLANFTCQGCNIPTFIDKNGNNFVESHHIIEYNTKEDGPDALQNLLVLCPNCHSKLHFARIDIIENFYKELRDRNVITVQQFKEIHITFNLLKLSHIKILLEKCIINESEAEELTLLLTSN